MKGLSVGCCEQSRGLSVVQKLLSERPILVGGLGLAARLSRLGGLYDGLTDSSTLISLIAAGAGVWWWRRQRPTDQPADLKPTAPVDRTAVEAAIAGLTPSLAALQQELITFDWADRNAIIADFEARRETLKTALDRSLLQVAIVGSARSGKSALMDHLDQLSSSAQPTALNLTEVALTAATPHPEVMADLLQHQDATIYLITEDLTESALADLQMLTVAGQRVMLSFNKQDNYLPADRAGVFTQVQQRLEQLPQPIACSAIATAPKSIKVRTYDATGQAVERVETPEPEVDSIVTAVTQWLTEETPHLVVQTVMRQVQQLQRDLQAQFNQVRHQQAQPLVDQLQWAAAATAFASPLPSLDLLAAIAINGQLVMDLSRVYQQPLALDQAKTIASELASVVVKLGLVEASTQLLTGALKSHAATFAVGGSVQAFSAAYLTRLSGESLMAYFEERALSGQAETALSAAAIGQKLQALLPTTQRSEFLQTLIAQGRQKLLPLTQALSPSAAPTVELAANGVTTVVVPAEPIAPGELA